MGVFGRLRSYSLSLGLLEKAEKVRYITYTLITPGCSRPEVGCTAGTHAHAYTRTRTHTHTHTHTHSQWHCKG